LCGIVGIVGKEDPLLVRKMADLISYRGPDGVGFYNDNNISLGHRRLSIVGISSGNQPMLNEEGDVCIVFNGEIYNHNSLRKKFQKEGYNYNTKSDTESILHSYSFSGNNLTDDLHGMYAFALWDSSKQKLILSRDPVGIKPLYYFIGDDYVIFSSEYKAILLDEEFKKTVDKDSLRFFLNYGFVGGHKTLIKNIKKLSPGSKLIWEKGIITITKPTLFPINPNTNGDPSKYSEDIKDLLTDSVKMRLMSDVPIGTTLSGGMDSTAIASILSESNENKIKAFTVVFDAPGNEVSTSKYVADYFGLDHYTKIIDLDKTIDILPRIIWHMEDISNIGNEIPTHYFTELASKHVKVLLIGEGSDELFGGYKLYLPFATNKNFPSKIKSLKELDRLNQNLGVDMPISLNWKLYPFISRFIPKSYRINKYISSYKDNFILNPELNNICKETLFPKNEVDFQKKYFEKFMNVSTNQLLDKCMEFYQKESIPNFHLNRMDKIGMSHSIECRVPFLDTRMIEMANKIPSYYKIRNYSEKYIYKKAIRNILPNKLFEKKKLGLDTPFQNIFNSKINEFTSSYLSSKITKKRGYFDYKIVEKMKDKVKDKNIRKSHRASRKLLSLIGIEIWAQKYLDQ